MDGQGFAEMVGGLVDATDLLETAGEILLEFVAAGLDLDGAAEAGLGFGELHQPGEGAAEIVVGLGGLRLKLQSAAGVDKLEVRPAEASEKRGENGVCLGECGVKLDSLLKKGN